MRILDEIVYQVPHEIKQIWIRAILTTLCTVQYLYMGKLWANMIISHFELKLPT